MDKFQVCGNYITRRGVTPDNEPKNVNTSQIKKMLINKKNFFADILVVLILPPIQPSIGIV